MGRRIKVIHVGDKFGKAGATIHGVTRLFSWWFSRWDTAEFDVDLVGLRGMDSAFDRLRSTVPGLITLNKGKFDPSTTTRLVQLIREREADIVHLHGYGSHNFGRIAARITGVRAVLHEHFVDPNYPAYQGVADRLLAGYLDRAFAVSRSVRDFMAVQRHMPEDRIEVLYNGAPLHEFQPASTEATAAERKRWGIPEDCVVVGTVGRLDEQKGNTYLLKALPRLIEKDRRLKVMIVGDGPLADPLRAESAALGLHEHVIIAGYQANIPLIQSLFDIQVFPSLYEGTPLTMFEAMSMGIAIVSTNVDGLGEVLTDEHNALIVPPMDAHALSVAIEDLIVHRERRVAVATAARQDSRNYDAQRMVDRMQAVYRELIRSPRRF